MRRKVRIALIRPGRNLSAVGHDGAIAHGGGRSGRSQESYVRFTADYDPKATDFPVAPDQVGAKLRAMAGDPQRVADEAVGGGVLGAVVDRRGHKDRARA